MRTPEDGQAAIRRRGTTAEEESSCLCCSIWFVGKISLELSQKWSAIQRSLCPCIEIHGAFGASGVAMGASAAMAFVLLK